MNIEQLKNTIEATWDNSIVPSLEDYIKIPCKSPAFDPDWQAHGYLDKAMQLIVQWCEQHAARDMQLEVIHLENRTPLLFIEIPGQINDTVLIYGHMDKQPEMKGWDKDLGPWKPVLKEGKLYGRGGADDGYAIYAALTAINALQEQAIAYPRCLIMIEASEESGSFDLPHYVEALKQRIGEPKLVICLDTCSGNYEQLWITTSLRGVFSANLRVDILTEGQHSGLASGVAASSFRILRQLLSRLEDEVTGDICIDELRADIPEERINQTRLAAQVLGDELVEAIPFVDGADPVLMEADELLLNRTWRPSLSVVGASGLPSIENAGNVLRPQTTLKLSLRLPPTCNAIDASEVVKYILERDPPYGAKITCELHERASGWNAPPLADWLKTLLQDASQMYYGKPAMYWGEGGSIPFIGMLGRRFPNAQFFVTGLLGPKSNAHGPNEFLHIDMAKRLTCSVAHVLANMR